VLVACRYRKYVRDTVHQNPAQARLGGTRNLVRAFLKIRRIPAAIQPLLEDGHLEGVPVWALVFYCIRCGDLEAAFGVLTEAG